MQALINAWGNGARYHDRSAVVLDKPLYGVASPEPDLSGNGNNGTVTGTVLADHAPVGPYVPYPSSLYPAFGPAGGTQYNQSIAGSITPAGALVKQTNKFPAGSITSAGALVKQTNKFPSGSITAVGDLFKQTNKTFAGSLTPSGILTSVKTFTITISGSLTPSGALVRQTNKALTGSISTSGALSKLTTRTFAGTITPAGAIIKQTGKYPVGSISPSGTLITLLEHPGVGIKIGSLSSSDFPMTMTSKGLAMSMSSTNFKMTLDAVGG